MTEKRRKKKRRVKVERLILLVLILAGIVTAGVFLFGKLAGGKKAGGVVTVMLDNAHGGDQSGYQGLISEDEYNEHVTDELAVLLENDPAFAVKRTHADGQAMAVSTRVEVIDEAAPDIVLSVRCHNGDSPNFGTMLVFADPPAHKKHRESADLARMITSVYTDAGYSPACGYYYYQPIKEGYFQEHLAPIDDETDYEQETWELMNAKAPVVIVSQINVNNEEECTEWNSEEGWKKAAGLYYDALKALYGKQE